jgi:hypothetical protein
VPDPVAVAVPIDLIAAAFTGGKGAGLRAWALCRAADPEGRGRLRRDELVRRLQDLGLSRTRAYEHLKALVAQGFALLAPARPGRRPTVVLKGTERLLEELGAGAGRDRVRVPVELLLSPAYKRRLATAAAARHNGEPIARATRRDLYSLSANSQRRAERDLGARVEPNVKVHHLAPGADPGALPAVDGRRVFAGRGAADTGPKVVVYERLPNTTVVPLGVTRGPRRRNSAASKATAEPTSPPARCYFRSGGKAERARRRRADRGEATGAVVVAGGRVRLGGGRARAWLAGR